MSGEEQGNSQSNSQSLAGIVHGSGKGAVKIVKKDGATLGLGPGEVIEVTPLHSVSSGASASSDIQPGSAWNTSPALQSDVGSEVKLWPTQCNYILCTS